MTRPGLQPQRTSLAWNRTALAGLGLLGAVVKVAADNPGTRTITCASIVIAHTLVIAGCAVSRTRTVPGDRARRLFLIAYASTLVAGVASVASIATSW